MENQYMILEFNNKSQIKVMTILGGMVNVNGVNRDVLTIEIDPKFIQMDVVKRIFEDTENLSHLFTYESDEDGVLADEKIEIGEGYTILLGVEEVNRKIIPFPGKIVPDTFETIYEVRLAQMTYNEWIESGYN